MPTTYAHYRFGRDVYKKLPWHIQAMVRETGISHSEMEAELDRDLMIRDGLDPMAYRPPKGQGILRKDHLRVLPLRHSPPDHSLHPPYAAVLQSPCPFRPQAVTDGAELIVNFMEHMKKGAPLDERLRHTFGEQ